MRKVSIIMVNYNGIKYVGKEDLASAVKSFLETDYPSFEFIFVDNNSDDGGIELVEAIFRKYPHIKTKIIKNSKNLGFAGGCNKGIIHSDGNYVCLVNNDDKPINNNWLKELVEVIERFDNVGAVFSKKMKWNNPLRVDARGMTINPAGIVCKSDLKDEISPCLIWQTPVLVKRKVIKDIGGMFDDDFVILHDDTDSSLRIWLAGYKILYVPNSIVLHKRSATMKNLSVEFVTFHGRKNIIQTLLKCYEIKNLVKWLPITLMIYLTSIFYFLLIKRPDQAKSSLMAIMWNVKNIKRVIKKRRYVQKNIRKVSDNVIFRMMKPFSIHEIIKGEKVWPK